MPETEQVPNFDDLSDEDLDRALDGIEAGKEPTFDVRPDPEPDEIIQELSDEVVQPEQEAVAETEAPADAEATEPETPTEEEVAEPTEEPEVSDDDLRQEQIAELEARGKHWEQVAGRHGGLIGHLQAQIKALQQGHALPVTTQQAEDEYGQPVQQTPQQPQVAPQQDQTLAWVLNQAATGAMQDFLAANEDAKELIPQIKEYIEGHASPALFESGNPLEVQQSVSRLLGEGYWQAKAAVHKARREQMIERRAAQTPKLAEAKRKASISGSSSSPPPKPKARKVDDLSDKELDAEMEKITGGRWF